MYRLFSDMLTDSMSDNLYELRLLLFILLCSLSEKISRPSVVTTTYLGASARPRSM